MIKITIAFTITVLLLNCHIIVGQQPQKEIIRIPSDSLIKKFYSNMSKNNNNIQVLDSEFKLISYEKTWFSPILILDSNINISTKYKISLIIRNLLFTTLSKQLLLLNDSSINLDPPIFCYNKLTISQIKPLFFENYNSFLISNKKCIEKCIEDFCVELYKLDKKKVRIYYLYLIDANEGDNTYIDFGKIHKKVSKSLGYKW